MRRSLLLLLGIVAITYVQFVYYPGHTYLAGESQTLVAAMERLNTPGFLSRDLVAINPNLTYTIYDEVTLFLSHVSGHDFEWVLAAQQVTFRFAGLLGILLLSLACGLRAVPALCISGLVNAGFQLPGIQLALTDTEPTPFAFALNLTLLAFGLLAKSKPLLAGLLGGIALAYQPVIAAVFWLSVLVAYVTKRSLRPLVKPTFPALLVFSLLLANAAQLQPGRGEAYPFFGRISESWMHLELERTPTQWLSTWGVWSLLFYVVIGLAGIYSLGHLWTKLAIPARWICFTLILSGLVSLPFVLAGQALRCSPIGEVEPARTLVLTVVGTMLVCSAAGVQGWRNKQRWVITFSALPILLVLSLLRSSWPSRKHQQEIHSVKAMARWAEGNTWGGSMFLFPDTSKSVIPGEFRGRAVRAVYVDWTGGALTASFPTFASEWAQRWHATGGNTFSVSRLRDLLKLPVEYVVLQRRNALQDVKPDFATADFVVYDAHMLQSQMRALRTGF